MKRLNKNSNFACHGCASRPRFSHPLRAMIEKGPMNLTPLHSFYDRRNMIVDLWERIQDSILNPDISYAQAVEMEAEVARWFAEFESALAHLDCGLRSTEEAMMLTVLGELLEGVEATVHALLNAKVDAK